MMRAHRLLPLAAAAALAAAPAAAQHGTTPPAPGPLRPYRIPPVQDFRLPNGVRVVVVEQHSLPIVNGRIIVDAGAGYEPAAKNGLASLTASLLDEGAAGMTGTQIAAEMARLGAQFQTGASYSSAFANVTAVKSSFAQAMALAAKTVTQPTFPDNEFTRVRGQAIAGYVSSLASVEGLANEAFSRAVFEPAAAYSRQPGGTRATLEALTLQDVRDWHRTMYSPSNTTLLLVGDVTVPEARTIAQGALGGWSAPAAPIPHATNPVRPAQGTRIILVDRPGSVQSGLLIGEANVGASDPDYFRMLALSNVLGGGFKARANTVLREQHGWTYGAFTRFSTLRGVGTFAITSSVRTNATDSAVAEVIHQYRRIATEAVPAEELTSAISNVVGSFPNTVQTVQGLSSRMETVLLYGQPLNYYATYRERLAAVTPQDIATVAHARLHPDALVVVVAGDLSKIEAPIRALNLGSVEVWDPQGNKVR